MMNFQVAAELKQIYSKGQNRVKSWTPPVHCGCSLQRFHCQYVCIIAISIALIANFQMETSSRTREAKLAKGADPAH